MLCERAKRRSVLLRADKRPANCSSVDSWFSLFFYGFTRKGVGKYVKMFWFCTLSSYEWFYLCSVSVDSARLSTETEIKRCGKPWRELHILGCGFVLFFLFHCSSPLRSRHIMKLTIVTYWLLWLYCCYVVADWTVMCTCFGWQEHWNRLGI